jgi:hypothetical protein
MRFPTPGAACKDRPHGDDPDRLVDGNAIAFARALDPAVANNLSP